MSKKRPQPAHAVPPQSNRAREREPARAAGGARQRSQQWTVMVYMAAAKEDTETERAAIRDLREMEKVGSTDDVHVVVQLDRGWPGYPERYYVEKDVSHLIGNPPPVLAREPDWPIE